MVQDVPADIERKKVIRFFSCIGFVATFLMASTAIITKDYLLAAVLICTSMIYCISFVHYQNIKLSANIILYTLYSLMLYLVVSGGSAGTGPIWICIVSAPTFALRGLKRGTIELTLFLFAVIAAFVVAQVCDVYHYAPTQLPYRIILSFIVVTLLSAYYEYSRAQHIAKIVQLSKRNEILATTDHLTGLPNRRHTMAQLEELKQQAPDQHKNHYILLADIDNFKRLNDTYGHNVGDEALIQLAKVFNEQLPSNALASRWGGEEFLIVIANADLASAQQFSDNLHQSLSQTPIYVEGQAINLSLSIGLAQLEQGQKLGLDIKLADELLYQAKAQGKNRTISAARS